jgi:hypothetical protein
MMATAHTNGGSRAQRASALIHDRRMAENPYQMLGLAAGVGFVIGGGLRRSGRALLAIAGRYLVGSFLSPALAGAGTDAADTASTFTNTPQRRRR